MLKTIKLCFFCLVPLGMLWLGAVLENARVTRVTAQQAGEPLSAILVTMCDRPVGFMVVSKDGHVHGIAQKDAEAVASQLDGKIPDDNTMLAALPCLHSSPMT